MVPYVFVAEFYVNTAIRKSSGIRSTLWSDDLCKQDLNFIYFCTTVSKQKQYSSKQQTKFLLTLRDFIFIYLLLCQLHYAHWKNVNHHWGKNHHLHCRVRTKIKCQSWSKKWVSIFRAFNQPGSPDSGIKCSLKMTRTAQRMKKDQNGLAEESFSIKNTNFCIILDNPEVVSLQYATVFLRSFIIRTI